MDIARKAGISHVTVSRAISGKGPVKQSTRDKIYDVIKETKYVANPLARGLAGGKTKTLGILWSFAGPHPSAQVVEQFAYMSNKHGYVSYVVNSLGDPEIIRRSLIDFSLRKVDGVLVQWQDGLCRRMPDAEKIFSQFQAAVLVTDERMENPLDQVFIDRCKGVHAVVDHFVTTGRKNPAIIGALDSIGNRKAFFVHAFESKGINVTSDCIINVPYEHLTFGPKDFHDALVRHFPTGKAPFDAVYCTTDQGAVATINWLTEHGYHVPRDVAVVGSNDSDFSAYFKPAVASLRRNDFNVVKISEQFLFGRLENPNLPRQMKTVAWDFVWRESAG